VTDRPEADGSADSPDCEVFYPPPDVFMGSWSPFFVPKSFLELRPFSFLGPVAGLPAPLFVSSFCRSGRPVSVFWMSSPMKGPRCYTGRDGFVMSLVRRLACKCIFQCPHFFYGSFNLKQLKDLPLEGGVSAHKRWLCSPNDSRSTPSFFFSLLSCDPPRITSYLILPTTRWQRPSPPRGQTFLG